MTEGCSVALTSARSSLHKIMNEYNPDDPDQEAKYGNGHHFLDRFDR
jgi:hypothetical protein